MALASCQFVLNLRAAASASTAKFRHLRSTRRHFRPHWPICIKVDRLALEGVITGFEMAHRAMAAQLLRRRLGRRCALDPATAWDAGAGAFRAGREDPSAPRAAARKYLAHAEQALGLTVYGMLAVVIDDLSWAKLGRRCSCDPKTGKTRAVAALKALAAV